MKGQKVTKNKKILFITLLVELKDHSKTIKVQLTLLEYFQDVRIVFIEPR